MNAVTCQSLGALAEYTYVGQKLTQLLMTAASRFFGDSSMEMRASTGQRPTAAGEKAIRELFRAAGESMRKR